VRKMKELPKKYFDNNKPIVIIGASNSGKTNLAVFIAKNCSHKDKFLLGYPSDIEGFKNISGKNELFWLHDCVVFVDEFARYFSRYGRHHNDSLEEALDFAEHRNIKLVLTSQNNQAIDRNLESKIKIFVMKRINVYTLKNGGMCRVAMDCVKDPRITSSYLALENNEMLWFDVDSEIGENGIWSFPDMKVGKDWKNVQRNVQPNVAKK